MKRFLLTLVTILLVASVFPIAAKAEETDPTQKVNRLRLVISTTSDWSSLEVPVGTTILNANNALLSGRGNLGYDSNKVYMWGNDWGSPASVQFDILLTTNGVSDGFWQILKGWMQATHLDVYNLNDIDHPVLIASQDCNSYPEAKTFLLSGSVQSQGGPLSVGNVGPKQVFAVYYPWWPTREGWAIDPNYGVDDLPVIPYGTSQQSDVAAVIDRAQAAGVDGFFSSWQGKGNGSDDGMKALIAAANQKTNFSVAAYMETRVANAKHDYLGVPDAASQPDPVYIEQWITDIVRDYGSAPSYLKMNKMMPDGTTKLVPVIVVYWAGDTGRDPQQNGDLTPAQWKGIFADLHSQGVDAFYMAETLDPAYLDAFDGMHAYHLVSSSPADLDAMVAKRSVATKTYSLLTDPRAQRKLYMGTVTPGLDTTWRQNPPPVFVDRANSDKYRFMWDTTIKYYPDWMLITSWNEFSERTYIEASNKYGRLYQDLTKNYSDQYKWGTAGAVLTLSGLNAEGFLSAGFEVNWDTNRPATSVLMYGTAPGNYTASLQGLSSATQHRMVVPDLEPGLYYARVRSVDGSGAEVQSSEFSVNVSSEASPQLTVSVERTYWPDYASYESRKLRVELQVANTDVNDVLNLTVTQLSGSAGVSGLDQLPRVLGTIPAQSDKLATFYWSVPEGVSVFRVQLWAQAQTAGGTKVYYPGPPSNSG